MILVNGKTFVVVQVNIGDAINALCIEASNYKEMVDESSESTKSLFECLNIIQDNYIEVYKRKRSLKPIKVPGYTTESPYSFVVEGTDIINKLYKFFTLDEKYLRTSNRNKEPGIYQETYFSDGLFKTVTIHEGETAVNVYNSLLYLKKNYKKFVNEATENSSQEKILELSRK